LNFESNFKTLKTASMHIRSLIFIRQAILMMPVAFCLLGFSMTARAQEKQLKMISYNVLHGFDGDSARMADFVKWVNQQNPDIIAYQELNGFNQEKLETLAARYGHPYVAINTEVTHPIGLSSRYPIVLVHKVMENMWHSYLYGNIEGVHVFVTHLSPFEVQLRRNDIRRIMAHIRLLPKDEPILLAGDMNALAVADSAAYPASLLQSMRKSEGRKEPKSGLPIVKGKTIYRNNLNNGQLDFTVTNLVLQGGLKDALREKHASFINSVPVKSLQKKSSHLRRIDYIFINPVIARGLLRAEVIKDETTHKLSDHYPMMVEFNLSGRSQ
jgi:exodeoxyribonuclease-3